MPQQIQGQHAQPGASSEYVRVQFRLLRDEDGYPPADNEILWARRESSNGFRLDNIPFYAQGVSLGDLVEAELMPKGPLLFKSVIQYSKHSTIRVSLVEVSPDRRPLDVRTQELRERLHALGCGTELSHKGFFAVDLPPEVSLRAVRGVLRPGLEAGLWAYEEPTLWHHE